MNFLIQVKHYSIPELRNGLFAPRVQLTSAIEILQHNAKMAVFFAKLDRKRVSNLRKKPSLSIL